MPGRVGSHSVRDVRIPRAILVAAMATAGAAPAWAAQPPSLASGARAAARSAPAGPVAPASAALRQQARGRPLGMLILRLRTAGTWRPAELSRRSGRALCMLVAPAGRRRPTREACLGARDGRPVLRVASLHSDGGTGPAHVVRASISLPRGEATVVVRPASLGLGAGPAHWSLRARWTDDGACAPEPGEPSGSACESTYPEGAPRAIRVRRTAVSGCEPAGRSHRLRALTSRKVVALTFDDGPSSYTAAVLAVLHRRRVPATFFVLGGLAAGRGAMLRRMLREGHAIGNHTWAHAFVGRGGPATARDLVRTSRAIRSGTRGYAPCLARAPGGAAGPGLFSTARGLGLLTIGWDVDPRDWARQDAGAIRERVLAGTRPGSIVVLHDGGGSRAQTVAALPGIIAGLRARGYRFATVPGLLHLRPRYRLQG